MKDTLSGKAVIRFYNPREDTIPIGFVDTVITEHQWIVKSGDGLSGKQVKWPQT